MNIFVLDDDPVKAAEYHCDKHVVKMILETAQLLSSVHHKMGKDAPYKLTHGNHPCSRWLMDSVENYRWLSRMGLNLCKEYTKRYKKVHKTQPIMRWLHMNVPDLPNVPRTRFPRAMPDDAKVEGIVESYRNYYIKYKSHFAKWKYSQTPNWYKNHE